MKKLAFLFGAFVLALTSLHAATEKIVCFGDSLTFGRFPEQNVNESNNWVGLLEASNPGITVVNSGKNGRRSDDFPALAEALAANPDATQFVIMLGTNDLGPTTDATKTAANIGQMIADVRAKAPESKILIMAPINAVPANFSDWWKSNRGVGPHTPGDLAAIEKELQNLASKEKVDFLTLREVVPDTHIPDGIHPDAAGHQLIAKEVAKKLQLK